MAKKDKKLKKNKSSKVETKVETPTQSTDVVNLFTACGLDPKHRSMFFQEARHMDEVPVVKNKTKFPYSVQTMPEGEFAAMLVAGGEVEGFYSRTGARLQNLESLGKLATGLIKGNGVYMGTLHAEGKKIAPLVSAFRKNALTSPQQITIDADVKFTINDYVNSEEFNAGTALLVFRGRTERLLSNCKKLIKKQGNRFPKAETKIVDSMAELEAYGAEFYTDEQTATLAVRGDHPYVAGHKNFHYMRKLPYIFGEYKCLGTSKSIKDGSYELMFEYGKPVEGKEPKYFQAQALAQTNYDNLYAVCDAGKAVGETFKVRFLETGVGQKPVLPTLVELAGEPKKAKEPKPSKKDKKKKKGKKKKSK